MKENKVKIKTSIFSGGQYITIHENPFKLLSLSRHMTNIIFSLEYIQ